MLGSPISLENVVKNTEVEKQRESLLRAWLIWQMVDTVGTLEMGES